MFLDKPFYKFERVHIPNLANEAVVEASSLRKVFFSSFLYVLWGKLL